MESDDSVDAPADSLKWAKNLFRARMPEASLIKRIVAVLTAELAGSRPAFGERSASAAKARQMLFTAGDHAIDLRVTANKKNFDIRGQILGAGLGEGKVSLEGTKYEASLSADGDFRLDGIPAGVYDLVIRTASLELVAEKIELK